MAHKKASKTYWSAEIDQHILSYNTETCPTTREDIYRTYLHSPLVKLVECIVHKYLRTDDYSTTMQTEVLHYLILQLHKYHIGCGKSFSYFSVIARNYMWQHNQKKQQEVITHVSIKGIEYVTARQAKERDEYTDDEEVAYVVKYPEQLKVYPTEDSVNIIQPLLHYIKTTDNCGGNKRRDKKIVESIRYVLNNLDTYDTLHKKSIYMVIRDLSGYKTEHIRRVINRIQRNYRLIPNNLFRAVDF